MANNKAVDDEDEKLDEDEDSDLEGADKEDEDADDEEKADDKDDEEKDEEPKTRNNLSHIIARKNRQIEKLKKGKQSDEEDGDDDEGEKDKGAERRANEAATRQLTEAEVNLQITAFLADPKNARFKKYENAARRHAIHPAYQQVPIDSIFSMLWGRDASKDAATGGEDEKLSKARAKRQATRGSSFRQVPESDAAKIKQMNFRSKGFKTIRERIASGETIKLEEE